MKRLGMTQMFMLVVLSFFIGRMAWAGTGFVKTQREDFGSIIEEGLENEKNLRDELHRIVGANKPTQAKKARTIVIDTSEQIVVPASSTLTASRKKAQRPSYQDLSLKRIAQEIEALEH